MSKITTFHFLKFLLQVPIPLHKKNIKSKSDAIRLHKVPKANTELFIENFGKRTREKPLSSLKFFM